MLVDKDGEKYYINHLVQTQFSHYHGAVPNSSHLMSREEREPSIGSKHLHYDLDDEWMDYGWS